MKEIEMLKELQVRADRSALWQLGATITAGVVIALAVVFAVRANDSADHERRIFDLQVQQHVAFRRAEAATTMSMMAALHDVVALGASLGCRAPSPSPPGWTAPPECAELRQSFREMIRGMQNSVSARTAMAAGPPADGEIPEASATTSFSSPPLDAGP